MMRTATVHRTLLGLLGALYLGFGLSLIPIGADDIRMVDAFSADEADILWQVRHLYAKGITETPSFTYGGALYYPLVIGLHTVDLVGAVTERTIVLALRGLCVLAGLGCLWLTYRIGCLVFHPSAGLVAVFLLVVTPTFLRWTVDGHPDLPQLFWLLAALWTCCLLCRSYRLKYLALASVFAGLAFGTKYGGGFLLPVIAAAVLLPNEEGEVDLWGVRDRLGKAKTWGALVAIPIVFALTFVATNPHALIHLDVFRRTMADYQAIMTFGHMYPEDPQGLLWLGILGNQLGPIHTGVLSVTLVVAGVLALRRKWLAGDRGILLLWCAVFLGYLILIVHLRRPRHLLPIMPCLLLFTAEGYRLLARGLLERTLRQPVMRYCLPLFLVALCWGQLNGAHRVYEDRQLRLENRAEDMALGRWLAEEVPRHTSIIYDAYAYVPPKFRRTYRTFGQTCAMANHFQPDLLVVRDAIAGRYRDAGNADRVRIGKDLYMDRHHFYRYLQEGRFPEYQLLRDLGPIAVYQRTNPPRAASTNLSWLDLLIAYNSGKVYGIGETSKRLGDIHASVGLRDEAEAMYTRAEESSRATVAIYDRLLSDLREGDLEGARRAWTEVSRAIAPKAGAYQATVRHHVADLFYGSGAYDDAAREATEALRLNPELRACAFDLGLFLLARGSFGEAEAAYAEAVKKHGADVDAAQRLRNAMGKTVAADLGMRILRDHFAGSDPP